LLIFEISIRMRLIIKTDENIILNE
jgi:hypothetical protein